MGTINDKKFILVTGGTSGIGAATSLMLLEKGYGVIIMFGNDPERAEKQKQELIEKGYGEDIDFVYLQADVSDEVPLFKRLDTIKQKERIFTLINNAGALHRGKLDELNQEHWSRVFGVNVFGIVNMSKWFSMNCSSAQVIINIGSIRGMPHIGRTNNIIYSVSKACIPNLTACLAKELGPKIRVVGILPGTIDTPQRQGISEDESKIYGEENTIVKRLGRPDEIASLCMYLISKEAEYITGTSIVIDGGYSINYIH